jgi:RimJ/RimL family protein N-acetyltransferase
MFTIKTNRLVLRDLIPEDWKLFLELMKEPETGYYMDDYLKAETEEEAKNWVKERISYNSESPRHSYNLAIELKGEPIGWIGIGEAESKEKKDLDFGYALKRSFWGQGLATEALQAVLKYCFGTMKIKRITGECETRNLASRRVMEKSGMTLEKTFTIRDKKTGQEKEKFRFFIRRS